MREREKARLGSDFGRNLRRSHAALSSLRPTSPPFLFLSFVRFHQSALLLLLSKGRPPSRTEAGIIADRPFGLSLSLLSLSISYPRLHHLDQVPSAAAFACSFPYTKSSAPGCPEIRTRASPCFNLNLGSASPTCVTLLHHLLHHAAHSADRCTSPMGSDQLRRRLRPQPRCNFLLGWSRFHCTINPIPGHPRSFHPRCTTKPLLRKSGFVQQGASPAAINGHRHARFGWCAEHGTCAPALGTLPGCSSSNNSKASRHPAGAPPSFPHRHRCHARTAHQPQL